MYRLTFLNLAIKRYRYLILLLFVVAVFSVILFFVYNLDVNNTNSSESNPEAIQNSPSNRINVHSDEFYNVKEPHWDHMPITYRVVNYIECGYVELKEAEKAFNYITNITGNEVRFVEVQEEADIELYCKKSEISSELIGKSECKNITFDYKKNVLSVYEEGILSRFNQTLKSTKLLERTDDKTSYQICYEYGEFNPMMVLAQEVYPEISGNIIKKGTLNLFLLGEGARCAIIPSREVHEIMHSFGFKHNVDERVAADIYEALSKDLVSSTMSTNEQVKTTKDLMFPYFNCAKQTKLDTKYVNCLKYIYSNGRFKEGDCEGIEFLD